MVFGLRISSSVGRVSAQAEGRWFKSNLLLPGRATGPQHSPALTGGAFLILGKVNSSHLFSHLHNAGYRYIRVKLAIRHVDDDARFFARQQE